MTTLGSEQHRFTVSHHDGRTTVRRLHVPTGTTVEIADLFFEEWLVTVEIIESGSSDALPPGWRGLDHNDHPIEFQRFAHYWLEYASVLDATSEVSRRYYSAAERAEIRRDVLLHVARGGSVASWLRDNPGRVSRSSLYRIVGRRREPERGVISFWSRDASNAVPMLNSVMVSIVSSERRTTSRSS